jgi:hypothetical protein
VQEHLETRLARRREIDPDGDPIPSRVERELCSYLQCGILACGFARASCDPCGHDCLVAFSRKGRYASGWSPCRSDCATSCIATRRCSTGCAVGTVQPRIRRRVPRIGVRCGGLGPDVATDLACWDHGGGCSLRAAVRLEAEDRAGLDRLLRDCARPAFEARARTPLRCTEMTVWICRPSASPGAKSTTRPAGRSRAGVQ